MRVRIILHPDNRAWIIEKMANHLARLADHFDIEAEISDRSSPHADLNHWMSYAFANERHQSPTSMFITHVDDPYKLALVRHELRHGVDVGICMSSSTVSLLTEAGVSRNSLCYILPAHDNAIRAKRIVIGITTRLYPDGRKREAFLLQFARQHSLSAYQFRIFGSGWNRIIERLREAGAEVDYNSGGDDYISDYAAICDAVPEFDYYLYLGNDEGSLGTLDALMAGVPTIVSPQGFHLDLECGITHSVSSYEDFERVMLRIASERDQRIAAASRLTWMTFVERHALVWRAVTSGRQGEVSKLLGQVALPELRSPRRDLRFKLRALHPIRVRSALSHISFLKPLRRWLKSHKR